MCKFQPLALMTDLEFILRNGLRHYLLFVTHHFSHDSTVKRTSLLQLSTQERTDTEKYVSFNSRLTCIQFLECFKWVSL